MQRERARERKAKIKYKGKPKTKRKPNKTQIKTNGWESFVMQCGGSHIVFFYTTIFVEVWYRNEFVLFFKKEIHFHCFNRYILFSRNSRTELNNNNDIIYARSFLSSLRINDNFFFHFCWCVILLISYKHTRIYRSVDSTPTLKSNESERERVIEHHQRTNQKNGSHFVYDSENIFICLSNVCRSDRMHCLCMCVCFRFFFLLDYFWTDMVVSL